MDTPRAPVKHEGFAEGYRQGVKIAESIAPYREKWKARRRVDMSISQLRDEEREELEHLARVLEDTKVDGQTGAHLLGQMFGLAHALIGPKGNKYVMNAMRRLKNLDPEVRKYILGTYVRPLLEVPRWHMEQKKRDSFSNKMKWIERMKIKAVIRDLDRMLREVEIHAHPRIVEEKRRLAEHLAAARKYKEIASMLEEVEGFLSRGSAKDAETKIIEILSRYPQEAEYYEEIWTHIKDGQQEQAKKETRKKRALAEYYEGIHRKAIKGKMTKEGQATEMFIRRVLEDKTGIPQRYPTLWERTDTGDITKHIHFHEISPSALRQIERAADKLHVGVPELIRILFLLQNQNVRRVANSLARAARDSNAEQTFRKFVFLLSRDPLTRMDYLDPWLYRITKKKKILYKTVARNLEDYCTLCLAKRLDKTMKW